MGNEPIWKVERQPSWLVVAIKKTIADLPGGYVEAVEWLDVTENALFNHLRVDGDQTPPLGWAMALQRAGGSTHIIDAVVHHSQDVSIPLADINDLGNADVGQRLMESVEWTGHHPNLVRKATVGGVIDADEHTQIEEDSYQVITRSQECVTLPCRIFRAAEKSNARECAVPDALANNPSSTEE